MTSSYTVTLATVRGDLIITENMSSDHTQIDSEIFKGCFSVREINLSQLTKIIRITNWFLPNFIILKKLILPTDIQYIGSFFLIGCKSIKEINLSNLTKLTHINNTFLRKCTLLETLILPPNIEQIEYSFLEDCTNITEVNLSYLTKLTKWNISNLNIYLVFIVSNSLNIQNYPTKLKYKSLIFINSFHQINRKSINNFTKHVILNVKLNIHLGII